MFLPAFTYTATAEVPLLLGATPVFADVDPRDLPARSLRIWNSPRLQEVRAAGALKPRAVIGVDLFGQPADWPAICGPIAERPKGCSRWTTARRVSARALAGRQVSAASADATATSFFPSKPLGAYGDGGALFTESDGARGGVPVTAHAWRRAPTRYEVLRTGMNGRLDTLQAAVLLAKLDVFDAELVARERVAAIYDRRLGNLLTVPARVPGSTSAWAVYAVLLPDGAARDRLQAGLRAAGVPSAVYYPRALHHQPAYAGAHDGTALPISEDLATRIMALPIHPDLSDADAERVCDAVAGSLG